MNRKYVELIQKLVDDHIYSGSTIAALAHPTATSTERLQRFRVRLMMNRYASLHLPEAADGWHEPSGPARIPGWFGWRWKRICQGERDEGLT